MEREEQEFVRGVGALDATMLVAGSMIGSGIFIVPAEIARQVGAPGWLLVVWLVTGALTIVGALSYGELAAMFPRAGGQYVYLREAHGPLAGFLYGWTFFLVIQTGTIAAVSIGFAKYLGELWPFVSESKYVIYPVPIGSGYAVSLSTAQLVAVVLIGFQTWMNTRGLRLGKLVQNGFTVAKVGALLALIVLGLTIGRGATAAGANFGHAWAIRPEALKEVGWGLSALTPLGLFVAICVAQTGSLFSSDSWNSVTFIAAEVKEPRRTVPLAMGLGTGLVIGLYLLANVAYMAALPFAEIQRAPNDRVATALATTILGGRGAVVMAVAIMVSTFGCNNGLILFGARAYYAMARDGLFFRGAARLNPRHVPAWALTIQGLWAAALVLPRTVLGRNPTTALLEFGNLYSDLLKYVISAAMLFYILTIAGIFRLRWRRPEADRPYRAIGYPVVPLLYIAGAATIVLVLFVAQPATTWPGLVIVASGLPVYALWRAASARRRAGAPATAEAGPD
jgi:APA family basic amino acid/polyamine antiporter